MPAIVDLAAMRDAMADLGGDPTQDQPARAGRAGDRPLDPGGRVRRRALAFKRNAELEFERNRERYAFLRWGQKAFDNFAVVPPNTGICHQVNLEYLARVSCETRDGQAFPDTLVGTDSHTTMVNGLGVLGWGVGGIEAEAAMLGQPVSMLIPQVVGFRLDGRAAGGRDRHRPRAHRHPDAARARRGRQVRRVLRPGPGRPAARRPRHDRQHVARVRRHLRDLPGRRRDAPLPRVHRPPAGAGRAGRGLLPRAGPVPRRGLRGRRPTPTRSSSTSATSSPAWPGRERPQDRVALTRRSRRLPLRARASCSSEDVQHEPATAVDEAAAESFPASDPPAPVDANGAASRGHRRRSAVARAARGSGAGRGGRRHRVRARPRLRS